MAMKKWQTTITQPLLWQLTSVELSFTIAWIVTLKSKRQPERNNSMQEKELKELIKKLKAYTQVLNNLIQAQNLKDLLACRELAMKITGQTYSGKE